MAQKQRATATDVAAEAAHGRRTSFRTMLAQPTCWALVGSIALAVLFGRLTLQHLTTSIVGGQNDGYENLWNDYWLRTALFHFHQNPFYSTWIEYPTGTSLRFHTLNPFSGLIALPLAPLVGSIAALNLKLLGALTCSTFSAYLLIRDRTGSALAAFAGAAVYTYANDQMIYNYLNGTENYLVGAAVFTLYCFLLLRAVRRERWGGYAAAATGALLALALTDWQYTLFAVLFTLLYFMVTALQRRERRAILGAAPASRRDRRRVGNHRPPGAPRADASGSAPVAVADARSGAVERPRGVHRPVRPTRLREPRLSRPCRDAGRPRAPLAAEDWRDRSARRSFSGRSRSRWGAALARAALMIHRASPRRSGCRTRSSSGCRSFRRGANLSSIIRRSGCWGSACSSPSRCSPGRRSSRRLAQRIGSPRMTRARYAAVSRAAQSPYCWSRRWRPRSISPATERRRPQIGRPSTAMCWRTITASYAILETPLFTQCGDVATPSMPPIRRSTTRRASVRASPATTRRTTPISSSSGRPSSATSSTSTRRPTPISTARPRRKISSRPPITAPSACHFSTSTCALPRPLSRCAPGDRRGRNGRRPATGAAGARGGRAPGLHGCGDGGIPRPGWPATGDAGLPRHRHQWLVAAGKDAGGSAVPLGEYAGWAAGRTPALQSRRRAQKVRVPFTLFNYQTERSITVAMDGKPLDALTLAPGATRDMALTLDLSPGMHLITLSSPQPPTPVANNGGQTIAFSVSACAS